MTTTAKTNSNLLADLANAGPQHYTHVYMQTMTSHSETHHSLECPARLKTLAVKCPTAEVVTFGDDTLGIQIDGILWASEQPHPMRGRSQRTLPEACWHYLTLALGRAGTTYA